MAAIVCCYAVQPLLQRSEFNPKKAANDNKVKNKMEKCIKKKAHTHTNTEYLFNDDGYLTIDEINIPSHFGIIGNNANCDGAARDGIGGIELGFYYLKNIWTKFSVSIISIMKVVGKCEPAKFNG